MAAFFAAAMAVATTAAAQQDEGGPGNTGTGTSSMTIMASQGSPCGDCGTGECVVVTQFCDADGDDAIGPDETVPAGSVVMTDITGVGQVETGDFFCTTEPTLTFRVRRGSIQGPEQVVATAPDLHVEVARVTVRIQDGEVDVDPGDPARVEVEHVGLLANNDQFYTAHDVWHMWRRVRTTTGDWSTDPNKTFEEDHCGEWFVSFTGFP